MVTQWSGVREEHLQDRAIAQDLNRDPRIEAGLTQPLSQPLT